MNKIDNKKIAQKRRRLAAMQRSYIFLNEWRKNDVWVGDVVHYHKPFSDLDHQFIVSRFNASFNDKTLYAFDIGTGKCLGMADDILALAGVLSTKNLKIVRVDSSYYCPFTPGSKLFYSQKDHEKRLEYSDFADMFAGEKVLVKFFPKKAKPYLIGYSHRTTYGFLNEIKRIYYLIDLSNGVIKGFDSDTGNFGNCLNDIASRQTEKDGSHLYPIILGTLYE